MTLDKAEQTSAWGARPLSDAQVTYAVADAHVLVAIADALVATMPAPPPLAALSQRACGSRLLADTFLAAGRAPLRFRSDAAAAAWQRWLATAR